MAASDVITTISLAVLGSGGIVGVIFHFFKKWLEEKLDEQKEKEKRLEKMREERVKVDEELHHAYGRMFFWIHYAITKGIANGELEKAFEELQEAEERKKKLDRQNIAEIEKA